MADYEFRISELQKEIATLDNKIEELKQEKDNKYKELNAIYTVTCPVCGQIHPNHDMESLDG